MATVQERIINPALRSLGVLAAGEVPTYDEANDALVALNDLLDQWAVEKLIIFTETRTVATLTASQASFTVGSGGNINMARPPGIDFIRQVNFQDTSQSPTYEYQMPALLTPDGWASITMKTQTDTLPQYAFYEPTYPLGTLYPWPIPTSATLQWVIYASTPVSQFAALTTTVSLPPAYVRMLRTNLAMEIAPDYPEAPPNPLIMQQAMDSKAAVKRANLRISDLSVDPGALVQTGSVRSNYSILAG